MTAKEYILIFKDGLSITACSEAEVIEISNKLKNTNYEQREINLQNSRYLDNERRRTLYQTWISQNRGQNRQLDNACSKALAICEAAARFPESSQESERLKAAQDAAEKWDAAHLGNRQIQTEVSSQETNPFEPVSNETQQTQVTNS